MGPTQGERERETAALRNIRKHAAWLSPRPVIISSHLFKFMFFFSGGGRKRSPWPAFKFRIGLFFHPFDHIPLSSVPSHFVNSSPFQSLIKLGKLRPIPSYSIPSHKSRFPLHVDLCPRAVHAADPRPMSKLRSRLKFTQSTPTIPLTFPFHSSATCHFRRSP